MHAVMQEEAGVVGVADEIGRRGHVFAEQAIRMGRTPAERRMLPAMRLAVE